MMTESAQPTPTPIDPQPPKKRVRRTLEQQIGKAELDLTQKRSRFALKVLAQTAGGQNVLRASRQLRAASLRTDSPQLAAVAREALELLAGVLQKHYSVLPEHILPVEGSEASEASAAEGF
jgi:predicted RNA-binding Zn ribbon-like protein